MSTDDLDSDELSQKTDSEGVSGVSPLPAEHRMSQADVNKLLYEAARDGKTDVVQRLLDATPTPEIDSKSDLGKTALSAASGGNHLPVMKLLVERRAQVSIEALLTAVESNSLKAITYLVNSSEDELGYVNSHDKYPFSALGYAVVGGKEETLLHLIKLGADPNRRCESGKTPVHVACSVDDIPLKALELLVNAGGRLNNQDDYGNTPLHLASREDNYTCVEWLLRKGADPSMTNSENETAWEVALKSSSFNAIEIFAFEEMERHVIYTSTAHYLFGAQWYQIHGGNNKIQIYALLRNLSFTREMLAKTIKAVSQNFQENIVHNFLSTREPSCIFDSLKRSSSYDIPGNEAAVREESQIAFVSLVMPFFSSTSVTALANRSENFTKLTQAEYCCCKEPVSLGIHLPTTLDEYCNPGLDTNILATRNREQVVLRCQRKRYTAPHRSDNSLRIVTVPQAWLWRVDKTIITVLPSDILEENLLSRSMKHGWQLIYGRTPFDPKELLGLFLSDLVDNLDRPAMAGLSDNIFSLFEKAIADLSEEVNIYVRNVDVDTISIDREKQFLYEIDDIREELSMIKTVLFQQEEVWKDFANKAWPMHWPDGPDGRFKPPEQPEPGEELLPEEYRELWSKIQKPQLQFGKFKRRIAKLDADAERVERAIDRKIDLKAKHTSLREAHIMAIMSAAIFGFTIITIIFTPLSFIVSLFALPIDRFEQHQIQSVWTNQAGMYSTNYIGKWIATAELVSVSLTLAIMWTMVEYGLRVHLARKILKRAKRLLGRASKEPQEKDENETADENAKEDSEHPKNEAEVSALQSKSEDERRKGRARYRKWLSKRETSKPDVEKGTEEGK